MLRQCKWKSGGRCSCFCPDKKIVKYITFPFKNVSYFQQEKNIIQRVSARKKCRVIVIRKNFFPQRSLLLEAHLSLSLKSTEKRFDID